MVAFTTPDCLPYFEGSDSPCLNTGTTCDPSTVWCDFANLVESRLDFFDSVIARTATSTPIAWIETTTPFTLNYGPGSTEDFPIPFSTVRIDTDNMVNLDANSAGFIVNTPGRYMVFAYTNGLLASSGGAPNVSLEVSLIPATSTFGVATINNMVTDMAYPIDDVIVANNVQHVFPILANQFVQAVVFGSGNVGESITFSKASLGIAWMGDLP